MDGFRIVSLLITHIVGGSGDDDAGEREP
jgi:hypothetical protein